MTTPDVPDFTPAAALVHNISNLDSQVSQVIAGGSSATFPSSLTFYDMPGVGYEFYLEVWTSAGTASPFELTLLWSDTVTGLLTAIKNVWVYAGMAAGHHTIFGRGPSRGSRLQVGVQRDWVSTNSVNYTFAVWSVSRPYTEDHWRSLVWLLAPGITPASAEVSAGIVGINAASPLGIGATQTQVLGLWDGPVTVRMHTASGTNDLGARIYATADQASGSGTNGATTWQDNSNSKGQGTFAQVAMPSAQCSLDITNNNAAGQNCAVTVTRADVSA